MLFHQLYKFPWRHIFAITIASVMVSACDRESDPDITAPEIEITSPVPGSNVTGSNAVTVQGIVSIDSTVVEVTHVIEATNTTVEFDADLTGTTFTADLTLGNNANTVTTWVKDGTGNSRRLTFTLFYPYQEPTNGMSATFVIGQNSFTANDPNRGSTVAANTLSGVQGTMTEWQNKVLYVADTGNHRVLGFNPLPTESDASANIVIGQANFTSAGSGTSGTQFTNPNGVFATNTQFFVADTGNNRVLIWDSIPANNAVSASYVVGQTDFGAAASGCSASTLSGPASVHVGSDKLVVADNVNHRILIWNTIPTANGVAADVVVGQQNLDNCLPNDSDGDGVTDTVTASTLNNPGGIWTDGTRLLVADTGNHRVLLWNTLPTVNGQGADVVLGQIDMTTALPELSQSGLNSPKSVTSNGNQIIVADSGNARALVWNTFPATNKPLADVVIGQADFTTNNTGTSETLMSSYDNVFIDRKNMFVVDGNRIMVFADPSQIQ
ncbi:NHL repeat-containing protein [Kaarinaea lacus]